MMVKWIHQLLLPFGSSFKTHATVGQDLMVADHPDQIFVVQQQLQLLLQMLDENACCLPNSDFVQDVSRKSRSAHLNTTGNTCS